MDKTEFLKTALKQDGNFFDNSTRHIRQISTGEGFFLKDGASEYAVLLSERATSRERKAAEELQEIFSEATGCVLPIITDGGNTYFSEGRYFAVGNNALSRGAELSNYEPELGRQGYVIKNYKQSVMLYGAEDYGTLYSVYDFLGEVTGFDYFNPGTYSLKKTDEIAAKNFNVKEIPDVAAFSRNYGTLLAEYGEKNVTERLRMTERADSVIGPDGNLSVHNMLMFLPIEKYGEAHPNWYTDFAHRKENYAFEESLCLTAHGDASEYALMQSALADRIKEQLRLSVTGNMMFFGQPDGSPACDCNACRENKEKYGADAGSCVLFLNGVLELIYGWFETDEGREYKRDFRILILAYLAYEFAPVSFDEKKREWTVNGGLKVHEKLGFIMAPIKYDFGALSTTEKNKPYYMNMLAWGAVTDCCAFYTYDFNTRFYFCPNETLVSKQELYRLMAGLNCVFLYDQGQWQNKGLCTGFAMLKIYLSCKLRWNVNLSVEELIERYFKGVYGEVWEDMLELYRSFRTYWKKVRVKADKGEINPRYVNYPGCLLGEHELWEFAELIKWRDGYGKILSKIEGLKAKDEKAYELLYRNVAAERVSVTYLLLLNYSNRFNCETLQEMRLSFKNDAALIRLSSIKEGAESWDGRHWLVEQVLKDWELEN